MKHAVKHSVVQPLLKALDFDSAFGIGMFWNIIDHSHIPTWTVVCHMGPS